MEVEDSSAGADFDITPRADNSIESTDVDDREARQSRTIGPMLLGDHDVIISSSVKKFSFDFLKSTDTSAT